FFKALGSDWDQFKTLFIISIRMDFRMQRASTEEHPKRSPIFRILIFHGLMSIFLASSLAPRVSLSLFSFLMLTYSMVMIMFAVILDFGNIIIFTDDADILLHRPISSRTYFLARYGNFLFYIVLMSVASCFSPSFIGLLIQKATWIFPITFLSVAVIANITAASFIIWIYTGLLNVLKYERFKDIILYIQVGFAFIIFLTYQLISRVRSETMTNLFELFAERLYFIPSVWYVGVIQMLTGSDDQSVQHMAFIGLAVTGVLIFLSFRRISLQYARHISDMQTRSEPLLIQSKEKTSASKAGFFSYWIKKVLQHPESVAAFYLTSHMIKHDRFVKMGIYPVFGIPFALMVLAVIEKRVIDPFVMRSVSELGSPSSMVVFFIFLMIYSFIMSMVNSRDWEASWLYRIAPLESPGYLYRGVRLAILLHLILPFFILFGITYCIQIPWIHGIQYTLSILLLALICFSCCVFAVKDYPFSVRREKGEGVQRYSFLIFMIPLFGLNLIVQHIAYQSYLNWFIIQFGLLVVFIILEIFSEKRLYHQLKYRGIFSS
ncbi:hypothetical protein MUP95_00785, partial [bacterium]|nr:hypothetical protein [bacterium]